MPYRRRNNRIARRAVKKYRRRRLRPQRAVYRPNAKYRLANKVELLRPVTLKPKSVVKKLIMYNTAEIRNQLIGGVQNSQHMTLYLNSLWPLQSDLYARQGTNTWNWNQAFTVHVDADPVGSGTSYSGVFTNPESVGLQYQNFCILGTKVTLTATPIEFANAIGGSPTGLFSVVQTQPNNLTNTTNINDIYTLPYAQVRKIEGGTMTTGALNGNTKSASIVLKYSPKRYNNIVDLKDNKEFKGHINVGGTQGKHPSEVDRITFGLVNLMVNPTVPNVCCPVMLQMKIETTCLFTEPFSSNNQNPAIPAGFDEILIAH